MRRAQRQFCGLIVAWPQGTASVSGIVDPVVSTQLILPPRRGVLGLGAEVGTCTFRGLAG
jgi:hypothetical protein